MHGFLNKPIVKLVFRESVLVKCEIGVQPAAPLIPYRYMYMYMCTCMESFGRKGLTSTRQKFETSWIRKRPRQ